ncbi:MAG: head-tail adaptor protein [Oscillospiraceae bacterium]|nr:head-tail adaptor protein [Oscillospiraceae bacterium]
MSLGKMNTFIDIVQTDLSKDESGFAIYNDTILASVRAYKEERHGTKIWANRAAFSTATCLFKFRIIPSVEVTPKLQIICNKKRYKIISAEDVRGRGMYIECLCEIMEASKNGKGNI